MADGDAKPAIPPSAPDPGATARATREELARTLSVLQSGPDVPPALAEVAAPVARAMSALLLIERSEGRPELIRPHAQKALSDAREALSRLQAMQGAHAQVEPAMGAVARAIRSIYGITRTSSTQLAAVRADSKREPPPLRPLTSRPSHSRLPRASITRESHGKIRGAPPSERAPISSREGARDSRPGIPHAVPRRDSERRLSRVGGVELVYVEHKQIFRDDTGRRWKRLRVVIVAAMMVVAALMGSFVQSITRSGTPIDASSPRDPTLDDVRTRAIAKTGAEVGSTKSFVAVPAAAGTHPSTFAVRFAMLDPAEDGARRTLGRQAQLFTHIALFGLHLGGEEGTLTGGVPREAVEEARAKGAKVLLVVDAQREGIDHASEVTMLGSHLGTAARLGETLAARVQQVGADGVLLDLGDDPGDETGARRAFVIEEVRVSMTRSKYLTAVALDPYIDPASLAAQSKVADLAIVRAVSEPISQNPSPIGRGATIDAAITAAIASVPRDKLVLAIGTRSAAWTIDMASLAPIGPSRLLTWQAIVAMARAASVMPLWDPATRSTMVTLPGNTGLASTALVRADRGDDTGRATVAWMVDATTLADAIAALNQQHLSGIGVLDLGGEDPRTFAVLRAARDDRAAMHRALANVPKPSDWTIIGDGIELRLDDAERDGAATIVLDAAGRLERETYDTLPANVTIYRRGVTGPKEIALTFDDGPDEHFTAPILDVLRDEGVKATFFMVGARVQREPELVRRIVAEGHEFGNHSFSHPDLGKVNKTNADLEINATNRLYEAALGRTTLLFRPPFRSDDAASSREDLIALINGQRNGMLTIASTLDPNDWAKPGADEIVRRVFDEAELKQGGVVLLHDGGGDRSQTLAALRPMIVGLKERGFVFKQVYDVLGGQSIAHVNPPVQRLERDYTRVVWLSGTWFIRAMKGIALFALALGTARFGALFFGALVDMLRELVRRKKHEGQRDPVRQVSIVVPGYNEAKVIERTIQSLLASEGVEVEIIVVDDGSTDGTAEVVRDAFKDEKRVRLVRLVNGGKARALNEGFRRATHEIVVAMDADTIFFPDTVKNLARRFDDPRVAAVAGRALVGNTDHFIGRWQSLEYVVGQAIERRAWHLLGVVSVVPGAVGAWRRDATLAAGGFGTDTLAEDSDLSIDLQVRGWRVEYAPDALALTEAPESVGALLKQRFRWCFGVLQTVWKHKKAIVLPPKKNPVIGVVLLPAVLLSHIATPLLAPIADIAALIAIFLGYGSTVLPYALALLLAELILTVTALAIDRGPMRLMWDWPINRSLYRWILFIALSRAAAAALRGTAVGWGKLVRTGTVQLSQTRVAREA